MKILNLEHDPYDTGSMIPMTILQLRPMTKTAKKAAVRMTENRKRLLQSTVYIVKSC